MRRYDREEIVTFVRSLDKNLRSSVALMVVGGSAAILGYDAESRTSDIDVYTIIEGTSLDVEEASLRAHEETHLRVAVGSAPVAELPYNYEDRAREIRSPKLHNLRIVVPDKYDLVLSKALRGYPHDLETIESVHSHHPLSADVLVGRFEDDVVNVVTADPRRIRLNLILVVNRLYGRKEADDLAKKWDFSVPGLLPRK